MDLSRTITLEDSNELIDIEEHFKLYAGPGAGKTRFLINHIKNVIKNSGRLSTVKKIACITYTNIGVDTINNRLDNAINEVEVSTIHSFLYKHVIKPYLWTINNEYNIPLDKLDGHKEIMPTYSILEEWKKTTNQLYIRDDTALKKKLLTLRWVIEDGEVILKFKYPSALMIRNDSLIEYKNICWKKALISHEDILYLSHKILIENSEILQILRAKFPYIFVDEFQDSNPIQSEILRMLGKKESIIGIIGDFGQSIYSFQGADSASFIDFNIEGSKLYKIENNYRSTQEIIKVLNHIRNDSKFVQTNPNKIRGRLPKILVGDVLTAYNKAIKFSEDEKLCTLSYRNDISNAMKFKTEVFLNSENINEPIFKDNNDVRGWMITYTIIAVEYCLQNKIKDAIKYMKIAYRKVNEFSDKDVLINLKRLVNNYDNYKNHSVRIFYNNYIAGYYNVKYKISSGKIKKYYENLPYKKIAMSVKINDDDSMHRTIHKSKGDEFNSVLLILLLDDTNFDETQHLEFLLNPDIDKEEHRVYYVALSRAIKNLFINIPGISDENIRKMRNIGFDVIKLE